MTDDVKTRSQEVAADVAALFRARNPLIWVPTREEARVEGYLCEAAQAAGYVARTWDCAAGACEIGGQPVPFRTRDGSPPNTIDDVLKLIKERAESANERCVWILRDVPVWIKGVIGVNAQRALRNLARLLPGVKRESAQAVVVLTPDGDVPAELAGHATVVEWPLPDRAEVGAILDAALDALPDKFRKDAAPNGVRNAAIDAAIGLSGEEAAATYAKSLVSLRRIDPGTIAKEKKRVIAREKVLEWCEPLDGGLSSVGGLDQVKKWMLSRTLAWTKPARDYGLPPPKGLLIIGIAGNGKSMIVKAFGAELRLPIVRLDFGALKSKFVGESETNLRKAYKVIEALGLCIVWIDEIEKAMQGAVSGSADGGVSADALGSFLTWMQERRSEAFVIATANDVSLLPPELLRKGRFDEVFWVDMPNFDERVEIVKATLRTYKRKAKIDSEDVAMATKDFNGAEIASLIPEAMFRAFADNAREISTKDILEVAKQIVPLAKTQAERIEALRKWAVGRARPATSVEVEKTADTSRRRLDIE